MRRRCRKCHKQKTETLFGITQAGVMYTRCKQCRGVVKEDFKYSASEMIQMLCFHMDTEYKELLSDSNKKEVALKRHILMFFLFRSTPSTLKEVASLFNRTDHTSTLYAVKKITAFNKSYPLFRNSIRKIKNNIRDSNTRYFYKKSNIQDYSFFSSNEFD